MGYIYIYICMCMIEIFGRPLVRGGWFYRVSSNENFFFSLYGMDLTEWIGCIDLMEWKTRKLRHVEWSMEWVGGMFSAVHGGLLILGMV